MICVDDLAFVLHGAVERFGRVDEENEKRVWLDPQLMLAVAGVTVVDYEGVRESDSFEPVPRLDVRLMHMVLQDVLADVDLSGTPRYGWLLFEREPSWWLHVAARTVELYGERLPLWRKLHPVA